MDDVPKLPIELMSTFRLAGVRLQSGSTAVDLYAGLKTKPDDPGRTTRIRLTPQMQSELIQSLQEAQLEDLGEARVQRLFDKATLTRVELSEQKQEGFVLSLEQTNAGGGRALPARVFLTPSQLLGLADLLGAAIAQHRLRPPPTFPVVQ